jgi:PAS domain S-box-containing protein
MNMYLFIYTAPVFVLPFAPIFTSTTVNIQVPPNPRLTEAHLETLVRAALEATSNGNDNDNDNDNGNTNHESVKALVEAAYSLQKRATSLEESLKTLFVGRAEQERSIEQQYKRLLEVITDYTFTVNVRGTTAVQTKHSANCVAITGYTSLDYEANPTLWFDMIHPDDRAAALAQSNRVLHEHVGEKLEHRIIHKNGSVRWVKNTPVLTVSDAGDLLQYDGLISDITARKEIEMSLRQSEERFRFIVELAPIGIKLVSPQNRILKANAAFCAMLGYEEHDLIGRKADEITATEDFDHEYEKEQLRQLLNGEMDEIEIEKQYVTRSGERVWVNTHSRYLHDDTFAGSASKTVADKQLIRIAIVENITLRKRAEEAVHHSEERLRALMQNANDAVVITDTEGFFTYCSPSVARMFYYSPDNLVGKNAYSFIHDEDLERITAEFRSLVRLPLNAMKTMQYRYRRADGSWAEIEAVSTNLLKHPLIGGVVTNARDISVRHRNGQD